MLGDINRSAAVLAPEGKSLEQTKKHENYRSCQTDFRIARQKTDRRRRPAHYQERYQKSEFSTNEIADSAEHQRSERTHGEADRECRERFEKIRCWISRWIKLSRKNSRETSEDVE